MAENKPVKTYKAKNLSVSVWENKGENETIVKSFSFQKSYKDANDEWRHTQNLFVNELPLLKTLLEQAYKDETIKEKTI